MGRDTEKKSKIRPDVSKCFTNGQKIRHTITNTWTGEYVSQCADGKHGIRCDGKEYQGKSPLNQFKEAHHKTVKHGANRGYSASAWVECEYQIDGEWISTKDLWIPV